MKLIHLSDIHFPKFGEEKYSMLINFLIENYANISEKPILIISGDLIENPFKTERFEKTFSYLNQLKQAGFTLLLCPGNHDLKFQGSLSWVGDNRKKFNQYFNELIPMDSLWFGTDLDSYPIIHKINSHYFIGLDSLEAEKDLAADGQIGERQLQLLKQKLAEIREEYTQAKIIVYLHHQPFEIMLGNFWMKLKDDKELLEIIEGVDCLLFGHIHINKRFELEQKLHNIQCIHLAGASFDNEYGVIITEIDTEDYSTNPVLIPN